MGHPGKEGHLLGSWHCAADCELQGAVVIQCPLLSTLALACFVDCGSVEQDACPLCLT